MLQITPAFAIADTEFDERFVRASGPGGQNVNKVASKVELRVELSRVVGLDDETRQRLAALAAGRLDASGRLVVTSQKSRDQLRNLDDARDKIRALIARALARPVLRRPTRPTRGSVERRIAQKKRTGEKKTHRRSQREQ